MEKFNPHCWHIAAALERLDGDEELLHKLCQIFQDECPKLMEKLRRAIRAGDPEETLRAARSLKGELRYLGGTCAAETAGELETMGRDQNLTQASERLTFLENELGTLLILMKHAMGPRSTDDRRGQPGPGKSQ